MEKRDCISRFIVRRLSRRHAIGFAARAGLGLAGATLLGCAAAPAPTRAPAPAATKATTPTAKQLDKLVLGHNGDIATLDPTYDTGIIPGLPFLYMVYDGLTRWSRDLKSSPHLAVSWEVPDERTWIFKLRTGVKHHNGYDFEAEDVKFTVERALDPETKSQAVRLVRSIDKAQVVDPVTAKITTKVPDPLLSKLMGDVLVYSHRYLKEQGKDILATKPVGTGAWRFVKWVKDDYVELAATDSHFSIGKPPIKQYIQRPIPSTAPRLAALLTGEADVIYSINSDEWERVEKTPDLGIVYANIHASFPHFGMSQFGDSPFKDKRVREAVNLAIDREGINKALWKGKALVLGQPANPGCFGYDETIKPYPYDPKRAKELLTQAGYPNGFETKLYKSYPTYPQDKEYNEAIMGYLRDVGIRLQLVEWTLAQRTFLQEQVAANKGPEGIFNMYGWCGAAVEVGGVFDSHIVKFDPKAMLGNKGWWFDPEVERLGLEARVTMDAEKRKELYNKMLRRIREEHYWIPLFTTLYTWGHNKKKIKAMYPRWGWMHSMWDIDVA
ncbi:MAG: hypothetical protein HYU86_12995 [Chloroflexi bacterium]|nr:hypothetical protein [Chloroflexota bacterium]